MRCTYMRKAAPRGGHSASANVFVGNSPASLQITREASISRSKRAPPQGRECNMKHFHAVVWIDHKEARVFSFGTEGVEHARIRPVERGGNIHHKAGSVGPGH